VSRVLLSFLAVALFTPLSPAAVEKTYFLGEARLSSEAGKPMGSHILLVEKTTPASASPAKKSLGPMEK